MKVIKWLEGLPYVAGRLTIEGYNTKTECELHPVLHLAILKRAVLLADMSRLKQPDSQINPMNY